MLTHRLVSALLIVSGALALLSTQLGVFPPAWQPYIVMATAIALAVSQSVQAVIKGEGK